MDISPVTNLQPNKIERDNRSEAEQEQVAIRFEKIFARRLVKELIKDSFKMGDNNGVMMQSNNLHRQHIVDTLANEIAKQRMLGMADLITQYRK